MARLLYYWEDAPRDAAANMATDLALLEAFPDPDALRLRHYGWTGAPYTFGYGQHRDEIRARCARAGAPLVRRPTGGGLVDHAADWTYALAVPFAHPLCAMPASQSYVCVHRALAHALCACGVPARLALCTESVKGPLPACFMAPSPGDVVDARGAKLAGAAQKRNRHGLLMQGSLARAGVPRDNAAFLRAFAEALADAADATAIPRAPAPPPSEALCAQFAADAWNARR